MPRRSAVRFLSCFFAAMGTLSQSCSAYEVPLSEHSVREAYFLGQRNDERTALFLDFYRRHLKAPKEGPYILKIELFTPYAEVVELSRQRTVGYSAQQAVKDYSERTARVRLRVHIGFTNTYGYLVPLPPEAGAPARYSFRPPAFWRDFRIRLSQNSQPIEPEEVEGKLTRDEPETVTGAIVTLTYAPSTVASTLTLVEVFPPEGQRVAATFDLEKLR